MSPLVSVLITAYNREKYIAASIQSVLNSSYKNFELIIVDDCSTDHTFEIANSFVSRDDRISIFKNEHNLGQFKNRNYAVGLAKSDIIKFLDSDDELTVSGLEVMVNSFCSVPDSGIGVCVPYEWKKNIPFTLSPEESIFLHFTGMNQLCYGPTGTIFSKKAIAKAGFFDEKIGILADTLLNIKIASSYPTVLFERDLYMWRVHDEQITSEQKDNVRMIRERYLIMKAAMEYPDLPLSEKNKKNIINNFRKINMRHFIYYLVRGQFKAAFQVKRDTELTISNMFLVFLKKRIL